LQAGASETPALEAARERRSGTKERASATLILTPHRNVWRLARAERAAVLIDAGRYFGALRQALIKAQSSVFFIGWDLDSRTRLVGESAAPTDG
jgi:phospholipase D1/2